MLNNLKIDEAINICIAIRDKLEFNEDLSLKEKWKEKDALAILINFAEKHK